MVSLLLAIAALPLILGYLGKKKARKMYLRKQVLGRYTQNWNF